MSSAHSLCRRDRMALICVSVLLSWTVPSGAEAQDSCAIQRIRLCAGCTIPRRITVQRDTGCRFETEVPGAIFDVQTRVAPRHGIFGKSTTALQAYVPRKGYVGPDYFEYVMIYEEFGKRVSVTIQNHVTVSAP